MYFDQIRVVVMVSAAMLAMTAACGTKTKSTAQEPVFPVSPPLLAPKSAEQLKIADGVLPAEQQLTWNVTFRGIRGGQAVLALGKAGLLEGRRVIVVKSRVETQGLASAIKKLRDDVTSWIDTKTSLPVRARSHFVIGERETLVETRFRSGDLAIKYRPIGKDWRTRTQKVPPNEVTRDPHASLAVLRAWDAAPGSQAYFYTQSGRTLWRQDLTMGNRETIRTKLGKIPSVRINAVAVRYTRMFRRNAKKKPRTYSLWISNDSRRLPLLLLANTEFGKVKIELVEYD